MDDVEATPSALDLGELNRRGRRRDGNRNRTIPTVISRGKTSSGRYSPRLIYDGAISDGAIVEGRCFRER